MSSSPSRGHLVRRDFVEIDSSPLATSWEEAGVRCGITLSSCFLRTLDSLTSHLTSCRLRLEIKPLSSIVQRTLPQAGATEGL